MPSWRHALLVVEGLRVLARDAAVRGHEALAQSVEGVADALETEDPVHVATMHDLWVTAARPDLPLTRRDEAGNTYQDRQLDDGSVHEVLKNFPSAESAGALLGPRARRVQWTDYTHYWVLDYELA